MKTKTTTIKPESGWTGTSTWTRHDKFRYVMPIRRWVAFRSLFTGKLALEWYVPADKKNKSTTVEPNDPPYKPKKKK